MKEEINEAGLVWKAILILMGFGIFFWGIAGESWIRMIGGFGMFTLGFLISSHN